MRGEARNCRNLGATRLEAAQRGAMVFIELRPGLIAVVPSDIGNRAVQIQRFDADLGHRKRALASTGSSSRLALQTDAPVVLDRREPGDPADKTDLLQRRLFRR